MKVLVIVLFFWPMIGLVMVQSEFENSDSALLKTKLNLSENFLLAGLAILCGPFTRSKIIPRFCEGER